MSIPMFHPELGLHTSAVTEGQAEVFAKSGWVVADEAQQVHTTTTLDLDLEVSNDPESEED